MKTTARLLRFLFVLVLSVSFSRAAEPAAGLGESAEAVRALPVGSTPALVPLLDAEGNSFDLPAAIKAKPSVIIFYRGSWCPYCNAQLAGLLDVEPKLKALGYQIIAISPDTPEKLRGTVQKHHLDYTVLSDHALQASSAFHVAFRVPAETVKSYTAYGIALTPIPGEKGFWLPVPSAFVLGTDGVIKFVHSDPNYKVRIDPAALLDAATAALKP